MPFTPGGGVDTVGRVVGQKLSEMWGQQVVVENKPGAGGNIASEMVARSDPDGTTLYISAAGIAVNQFLFPSVNYDPVNDFRAGVADLLLPQSSGRAVVVAVQVHRRSAGLCAGESRQAQFRLAGPRQLSAHERRIVQAHGEGRHHARAVSRGCAPR